MQDCSNSIANAVEMLQSCNKPSSCQFYEAKEAKNIVYVWSCSISREISIEFGCDLFCCRDSMRIYS